MDRQKRKKEGTKRSGIRKQRLVHEEDFKAITPIVVADVQQPLPGLFLFPCLIFQILSSRFLWAICGIFHSSHVLYFEANWREGTSISFNSAGWRAGNL